MKPTKPTAEERRAFLASLAGSGALLIAAPAIAAAPDAAKANNKEQEIPPTEDLMREHGVLRRVLLVYQDAVGRLGTADDAPVVGVIGGAAAVVRRFVEGYHEKLEENFVLPALEKRGQLVELAKTIRIQHAAGRKLTESILNTAKPGRSPNADQRRALVAEISAFARMYAAHAAWEDTELFPAYRQLFSEKELDALGDKFEDQEHKLLGAGGFEGALKEVGDLEKALGIHDLAKFTPQIGAPAHANR